MLGVLSTPNRKVGGAVAPPLPPPMNLVKLTLQDKGSKIVELFFDFIKINIAKYLFFKIVDLFFKKWTFYSRGQFFCTYRTSPGYGPEL